MLPATIEWKDGKLRLLDQRLLPSRTEYAVCESAEDTALAIENMTVRGAPAIGVAAAYGLVLALKNEDFAEAAERLAATGAGDGGIWNGARSLPRRRRGGKTDQDIRRRDAPAPSGRPAYRL